MLRAETPVLLLAAMVLAGCDESDPAAPGTPAPYADLIAEIQAATESFAEIDAATAAGYQEASPCVENGLGAMGFHYANNGLIDGTVEVDQPEMLLYVPESGGMRLVGVEYMVAADAWDGGHDSPPMLADREFADHRGEADRHGIPFPHYDLHAWAWEENPLGLFEPFNPSLNC